MVEPEAVRQRREQIEPYRSVRPVETSGLTSDKELAEARRQIEFIRREIKNDPEDAEYRLGDKTITKAEYEEYLQTREIGIRQYETRTERVEDYVAKLQNVGYTAYIDQKTGQVVKIPPKGMPKEKQIYYETIFYPGQQIPLEGGGTISKKKAIAKAKAVWEGYKRTQAILKDNNPLNALSIVAMFFTRPGMSGALTREVRAKLDLGWAQFTGASKEEIEKRQREAFNAQWDRASLQANATYEVQSAIESGNFTKIATALLPEIIYGITLATSYGIARKAGELSTKAIAKYGATSGAVKTATAVKTALILGMGTPMAYQIMATFQSIEKIEQQKAELASTYDTRISKSTNAQEKQSLKDEKEYYLREYDRQLTYAYGLLINLGINTIIFVTVGMKGYKAGVKVGFKKYFYPGTKATTTFGKQTVIGEQKTGKLIYQQEFKQQLWQKSKLTEKQMPISKPYKFRVIGKGQIYQESKMYIGKGYGFKVQKGTLATKTYRIEQYKGKLLGWRTLKAKAYGITGPRTQAKIGLGKRAGIKFTPEGTELSLTEEQMTYPIYGRASEGEFYPSVAKYKGTPSKQLMQLREVTPEKFQQRVFIKGKYPGVAKFRSKYIEYKEPAGLLPPKRSILTSRTATQMLVPTEEVGIKTPSLEKQLIVEQQIGQIPVVQISAKPDIRYKFATLTAQGLLKEQVTKPKQIVKIVPVTLSSQKIGVVQAIKIAQVQAQKQYQLQKQTTARVFSLIAPVVVPIPATTPPPPYEEPEIKKRRKKGVAYNVQLKENNTWVTFNPEPFASERQAIGYGAKKTDQTVPYEFRITKTNKRGINQPQYDMSWGTFGYKFTKKGNKYIEKPQYREDYDIERQEYRKRIKKGRKLVKKEKTNKTKENYIKETKKAPKGFKMMFKPKMVKI